MHGLWHWLGYAVTCALSHQLLASHYTDTCRPSWWFGIDTTPYCAFLHKSLHVLRASPLLALPVVPRLVLPG